MSFLGDLNSPLALGVAGIVVAASFAAFSLTKQKHDSREPPLVSPSIPLIGHLIGMSRETFNYYVNLCKRVPWPIFTVAIPGQKMYVVSDATLIQKIQKQHELIAFNPIAAEFAGRSAGISEASRLAVMANDYALVHGTADVLIDGLRPGENLDGMNRIMLEEIGRSMQTLQPAAGDVKRIHFYKWLRQTLTKATTRSLYGPQNPYEDEEIASAFWDYENGLMALIINFLPSITAKKPTAAREKVAAAILSYYRSDGLRTASDLARGRHRLGTGANIPEDEVARFEVGMALAVLVNTGPVTFWMILLICARPELRDELRAEVDACTETTVEDGVTTKTIDILNLKEHCPLLLSTYQETLRYSASGTPVRKVMGDTYIDQWLLKKDAMVHMPTRAIHQDVSVYGPSATQFEPRRFLPSEKKSRPKDHCFRAFGGGKHLCPGRHFATNEVLATAAMFIARFDMEPASGTWDMPTVANTGAAGQIMEPDYDVEVELKARAGYEDVRWSLRLKTSDKIFAIVTEDTGGDE